MSQEQSKLLVDADGVPIDRINGFETEYGFQCSDRRGPLSERKTEHVHQRALGDGGEFNEDGTRFYLDCGHPELSTAEQVSYFGSAYGLLRGHVTTAERYRKVQEEFATADYPLKIRLFANTSDTAGNSWSSHENLIARRGLKEEEFIPPLAIHNLSRIVWSGVGKVLLKDWRNKDAIHYYLSEKAEHIWTIASIATTRLRPLVNLRDEPLADSNIYRRIHGIAGESVFSPTVNALRQSTTSIISRATELGVAFDDLWPEDPIKAIRAISHDPSLKERVRLENGKEYSGLDLQRALAERAIAAAQAADYLTPQEQEQADIWIELLDNLSNDPASCADVVDWVVKQQLIEGALDANKGKGVSRYDIAEAMSLAYHRLLPSEGVGMQLIRKGFFKNSPSPELLDEGMDLPPTRAKLRGTTIGRLLKADVPYIPDWWNIIAGMWKVDSSMLALPMKDPYATESTQIESYLEAIGA